MGRHSKPEQPEDEPGASAQAPPGRSSFGPSAGPRYDGFTGPTDDQVFVSRPGTHRPAVVAGRGPGPASTGPHAAPPAPPGPPTRPPRTPARCPARLRSRPRTARLHRTRPLRGGSPGSSVRCRSR
ncbi:hypothetical protein [Actinomadura sp. CNU-125]|uniref:hypothetical protein n=1 Tax=Actinomadura sp. CNU-125 TaxID=1904961 RepID=UPI0009FAD521|nr:hypothetical protein [Actinomadura sp. CNU-125]